MSSLARRVILRAVAVALAGVAAETLLRLAAHLDDAELRGALRAETRAALAQVKARGWLRPEAIDETWRDYEAGRAHWSRVWAVVALNSIGR